MSSAFNHEAYNDYIEHMRMTEYPMLEDSLYLDHAGATLYSKKLMDRFHAEMMSSLYGNPHSASPSSQRSTQDIESIRMEALNFFSADPNDFDLVFTANTTAAIKLVLEAFREHENGFWYGYHADSHTSLVGVREAAKAHRCFESDDVVEKWLEEPPEAGPSRSLFAYPAQSNMNGRRLPTSWTAKASIKNCFTLCDAAAYAATAPLRLDDVESAPDFTVLSFAKIFGFPDLGALIVKKKCAHLFERRRYFGGGTVDLVACVKEEWHVMKCGSIHEQLEDGTLPVHSIAALGAAIKTHAELFRSIERIACHTARLTTRLYEGLSSLVHMNGRRVCKIYTDHRLSYDDWSTQGPIVAFNLMDSQGRWVSNAEVEKLTSIKNIHLRTGGLCNPGGIANALDLSPWQMRENFSAGFRCGSENDIMNGKPTGVIRVSLGAISTMSDVARFLDFITQFFVDNIDPAPTSALSHQTLPIEKLGPRFYVESLTVYPIKSCAGWQVPYGEPWDVRTEGLAWDREWCIVKKGTGAALSQKAYPRMALLRPHLDFKAGVMRVRLIGSVEHITIPLSKDPRQFTTPDLSERLCDASVCGDKIKARMYTSSAITEFFTSALGVPCTLARFPAASQSSPSVRHSKAHLPNDRGSSPRPILLSNESPILTISRSSLNRLNETIKAKGGKAAHHAAFRANIIVAENPLSPPGQERPWAEDDWVRMTIGDDTGETQFDFLGGCRRCQMVCVDQKSGEKNQEPFVTLAKTRRFGGKVMFGVHTALKSGEYVQGRTWRISSGSPVKTWNRGPDEV
ncbi:uncharacterized protein MYCFIDRAFT_156097 [Pseudocercospora fijiensis CIRAD86]|uniref:Molybdenum cofactor sulfurase n=1 Tax=Pseudocercospora fijiensis (strain CIRAD86) TaxID=383855 RepID=M2ZMM2_PSEFD|nr:uncharacterized protein MYCFIDRAFT_156097 [Pseudocercospora fijiensis CIRAD86]EME80339.1 hypothetical protein MYCFIDRAFT_156097 [Pseudocercospora fijiensis CIRAD86]